MISMLASLILAIACFSSAPPTLFDGSLQEYAAKISETGTTRYFVDAALQHEPILIRSPDLALESPRIRELVAQAVEGPLNPAAAAGRADPSPSPPAARCGSRGRWR